MQVFVSEKSVVRKIWGNADTILFIFAGASAEFALNKAVDWLYFTGKLPADPLARLFSTVAYAQQIVFADYDTAMKSIDKITAIHKGVEEKRGSEIPAWAYRDVLFMLIEYSINAFELLERKLTTTEKEEVFTVFQSIGSRMGIKSPPATYNAWVVARKQHLADNLISSDFTIDLYKQYRKHLGWARYQLLLQAQQLVAPPEVLALAPGAGISYLRPIVQLYKLTRKVRIDGILKNAILPKDYKVQIRQLDMHPRGV